ncbi:MAG: polyprenyl synthetase family protein [Planctomycetaceae bacterium]|nr:polyprenyl synthetase family protein [Planctomycetaceae bacterium]
MPDGVLTKDDLKARLHLLLEPALVEVNRILLRQFRNPNSLVQELCDHVSRYRGKQIRPMLVLLTAGAISAGHSGGPEDSHGGSGVVWENVHRLAAVVELIHTATLVHDDVIDDADIRRHVSTVHRRWNAETSVLLGDYLFSRAFHLAATTGDAEACREIGRATDKTCEGELNQIAARLEQSQSERDYLRVIAGKTGQLFGVSCVLGGRAAGASPRQVTRLRQFGLRLGMAFQIADDVIDLTENAGVTGKDSTNDLSNHRLTLPLLRALSIAGADDRQLLIDCLQSDTSDGRSRIREHALVQAGVASARNTAEELVRRAVRCVQCVPAGEHRLLLEAIAQFAVNRSA